MEAERRYKLVESPAGVGEIWRRQGYLARVTYLLNVHQEVAEEETLQQDEVTVGLKSMTGSISVLEGNRQFWRLDALVLHLQDGRKVSFMVKDGDVGVGSFRIQPSGGFRH
jgi:hypothetical protein